MEQITLPGRIVPYIIIRKAIKHVYLRVKPEGHLLITANRKVELSVIESLIRRNQKRILTEFILIDQKKAINPDEVLIFGKIYSRQRSANWHGGVALIDEVLMSPQYSNEQKEKNALEKYYMKQIIDASQTIIDTQTERLAKLINGQEIILKSQKMKSRFGSCLPQKRVIKINSLLGRFDPLYLETILIHELVHLQVANHSQAFYSVLLALIPDYRRIHRYLNRMVKTIGV